MSPEALSAVASLARLRSELSVDRSAIDRWALDLQGLLTRWPEVSADRAELSLSAMGVHSWYTGLETLLERTARTLDAHVPAGARSHAELLSQLMAELPNVRPAVLPRSLESELRTLLAFRHFFRHAYTVEFDPVRVRTEVERLLRIEPEVKAALTVFDRFLDSSLRALTQA